MWQIICLSNGHFDQFGKFLLSYIAVGDKDHLIEKLDEWSLQTKACQAFSLIRYTPFTMVLSDTGLMDCWTSLTGFCTKYLFDSQKVIRKPQITLCARTLSLTSSWLELHYQFQRRDSIPHKYITSLHTNKPFITKTHLKKKCPPSLWSVCRMSVLNCSAISWRSQLSE